MSGCVSLYLFLPAVGGSLSDDGWVNKAETCVYTRRPFYQYIQFLFLRQVLFDFNLGPWAFRLHIHDLQNAVKQGCHLMEWASIQIRYQFATLRSFVLPLPQHMLQLEHHCKKSICGWLDVPFENVQSAFLYQRCQNIGVEALCRHQLIFSMFNELWRCYLQQWGLSVGWREIYTFLETTWNLGIPVGPLWPSNSIRYSPVSLMENSFGDLRF